MRNILVLIVSLFVISSCSPVGVLAGAGATLGIAAAQEGGISGAAEDVKIKALISDRWFRYDISTFSKLNLNVDQGRVLITGVVQNPDARVEAVRLAWQVEGVRQVINEIRIAKSDGFPGYVRDQWITTRLRAAMTFDRDVQSINYSIDTVQGSVFLMGVAQSQSELNRVIETARTIPHVKQVISYVKQAGETVDQFYDAGQSGAVNTTGAYNSPSEPSYNSDAGMASSNDPSWN
jgi:osmotically-inducible protein OsmY